MIALVVGSLACIFIDGVLVFINEYVLQLYLFYIKPFINLNKTVVIGTRYSAVYGGVVIFLVFVKFFLIYINKTVPT